MNALNENYVYDLSELTSEEKEEVGRNIFKPENIKNVFNYNYIKYIEDSGSWFATSTATKTTNAKELFYTLENAQVDCRDLSEEQIEKVSDIYHKNKISPILTIDGFITHNCSFILNTITYEKFMELFGYKKIKFSEFPKQKSKAFKDLVEVLNEELTEEAYKETEYEVKYIAEKPQHYAKGIDTFARMEANCTTEECLAFAKGNIDKYNFRTKGQDLEDYKKIVSYANWAIGLLNKA